MPDSIEPNSLRHVAIIMDGNSRWARDRGLPTIAGHRAGADRLKEILECCRQQQIQVITVFAFSSENWRRPKQEVGGLMSLFASSLRGYRKELVENDVQLRVIGRRDRFSDRLNKLILDVEKQTAKGSRVLVIAADYGGQWDIAQAARHMAEEAIAGKITPDQIDEDSLGQRICLNDLPDLDLLIRTGAETRVSNFLLWQLSYAELFFTPCYWPDFDTIWFNKALESYHSRQRRYGADSASVSSKKSQKALP